LLKIEGPINKSTREKNNCGCVHEKKQQMSRFAFDSEFLNSSKFNDGKSPFGFNGLGELVYRRTYARENEQWIDTCARVVAGTMDMLTDHVPKSCVSTNPTELVDPEWQQKMGQEMFERMFFMKFLPPGRGLWAMGSSLTREKKLYAALNNCGFVSTKDLAGDPISPFTFLMDASMLGVGIGFDTKNADTVSVLFPPEDEYEVEEDETIFVVPDSREGWVEALEMLLSHYLLPGNRRPVFDYSMVREAGQPLKGFGGVSSGPGPLKYALETIDQLLERRRGQFLSITDITDIMNIIGKCVVSGNVRRSAEIAFGDHRSNEFLDLKDYSKNPERADHGWVSNNSIMAEVGMDYGPIVDRILANGEPGLIWLDNMRRYSRMGDAQDDKDALAEGSNPCVEVCLFTPFSCFFPFFTNALFSTANARELRALLSRGDVPQQPRLQGGLYAHAGDRAPLRQDGDAGADPLAQDQRRHAAQPPHGRVHERRGPVPAPVRHRRPGGAL